MAKGLGKGFDSLLPVDFDVSILQDERDRIKKVLISDIKPNPSQPRTYFDSTALEQLADSISQHGILQPIIIKPLPNNGYQIVAGERRWRAAQLAGLSDIPAIIRSLEELTQLELSLIENVQRVDLSPLEQALSIHRLHHQFSLKFEEIAKRLGKAVSTVHNLNRLLNLPQNAKQALQEGKISEGHARAILALNSGESQENLLKNIVTKKWTVRQAEQYVLAQKAGVKSKAAVKRSTAISTPQTKKLSIKLGTNVSLKRTAKGGALLIMFKNDEHLNELLQKL